MLAWLLIVSLLLFIFFRPSPDAGGARPSVRGGPAVAPSRTKQRLTINTSCLGDDTSPIEELATLFDVHIVETVESHAELWTSPHDVSVVHASTHKGFVSALKQIDPHVHVDKNDAAGAAPQPQGASSSQPEKPRTVVREGRKVGRNEPCPCGSGKKYKQCCGKLES